MSHRCTECLEPVAIYYGTLPDDKIDWMHIDSLSALGYVLTLHTEVHCQSMRVFNGWRKSITGFRHDGKTFKGAG